MHLGQSPAERAIPLFIWIETQRLETQTVRISIANNGPEIPIDIRTKLFDPFFTTKTVGKGTGLGLSISYQIVTEKHRGQLWLDPTFIGGTQFVIDLPIAQADSDRHIPSVISAATEQVPGQPISIGQSSTGPASKEQPICLG
jgi:signal transduction histidine kinase